MGEISNGGGREATRLSGGEGSTVQYYKCRRETVKENRMYSP